MGQASGLGTVMEAPLSVLSSMLLSASVKSLWVGPLVWRDSDGGTASFCPVINASLSYLCLKDPPWPSGHDAYLLIVRLHV